MNDNRSPALIAAHLAADAVAALLLHDSEDHFGDVDVVEKLAEAIALAVDMRLAEVETCDHDYRSALEHLRDTAAQFLLGYAG